MKKTFNAVAAALMLALSPAIFAAPDCQHDKSKPTAASVSPEMDAKMADSAAQLAFELASEVEGATANPPSRTPCAEHGKAEHEGHCQKTKGCAHTVSTLDGKRTVLQGHCPKGKS